VHEESEILKEREKRYNEVKASKCDSEGETFPHDSRNPIYKIRE